MKKNSISAMVLVALASSPAFAAHTFVNDDGDSLTLDGRFEVRYQDRGGDDNGDWNSGSSRFGLKGQIGVDNGWAGFGHAEWGYRSGSNGNDIFDRLLYAGVKHDEYGKIAAGSKQWSTFYDVAWYTDAGRIFGSRASGAYNLADWGISSGTGRAENSITYRNKLNDKVKFGFTYQTSREDVALSGSSTATLNSGIGASITVKPMDGLTLGLAYHQNELDDLSSSVQGATDGDHMRATLLGANYKSGGFFTGITLHVGENWESVNMGDRDVLFDTFGSEITMHYHFDNGFRTRLIYNYLEDRGNDTAGYERNLLIPGLEYHFKKDVFLVWAEYQVDLGDDQFVDGAFRNRDDQFATGIRYYF